MTTATQTALPQTLPAREAAARFIIDSAHELLDGMNGVVRDPPVGQAEFAFWHHMNAAWQLIQRVEHGRHPHSPADSV